jgi:hypothetical protein
MALKLINGDDCGGVQHEGYGINKLMDGQD